MRSRSDLHPLLLLPVLFILCALQICTLTLSWMFALFAVLATQLLHHAERACKHPMDDNIKALHVFAMTFMACVGYQTNSLIAACMGVAIMLTIMRFVPTRSLGVR